MTTSGSLSPVDLSANENPLGPSPKALAAIESAMYSLSRYPDRACGRLKSALAERLRVGRDEILVGNGSCEVLELAARALAGPGDSVVLGTPGFPAYRGAVERAGAEARMVPARGYFDDLEAMLSQIDETTRLVVLGNPANPAGTLSGREHLKGFLRRLPPGVALILDEAYRDFVDTPEYPDAVELHRAGWPVMALRSFSKAHGLAGMRIGYAVAASDLVARMDAGRQQFSTNGLAQAAALAALNDDAHLWVSVELNRVGRGALYHGLVARGLDPVPSQASFVLVPVGDAPALVTRLAARGVLVKALERYGLEDHIRISTGLPDDHRRFFEALDDAWGDTDTGFEGLRPPAAELVRSAQLLHRAAAESRQTRLDDWLGCPVASG